MKTLIIQTSPKHTASTLLVNALYGIIPELFDKKIAKENQGVQNIEKNFDNLIVVKTHKINIDELIENYGKQYNLFFVCSERNDKNLTIEKRYKDYVNVIAFDYNELNETEQNSLTEIVNTIYIRLNDMFNKNLLDNDIKLDKNKCVERILQMNARYEEIKLLPFTYIDPFFEIHGSHRDRKNK